MKTEKATKVISASGDSLVINVTKEVKRLGLGRGEYVDVELSSDRDNDLEFLRRIVNNAISATGLKPTETYTYTAEYATVSRIASAVGDCCGRYDVGIDHANGRYYLCIFDNDRMLLEVVFIDPGYNA